MNNDAADLADGLIDGAIDILRRDPRMPALSLDEWGLLFADVRDDWMRWLPNVLEELAEEEAL